MENTIWIGDINVWPGTVGGEQCIYIQQTCQPGELETSRLVVIREAVLDSLIRKITYYTEIRETDLDTIGTLRDFGYREIDVNKSGRIRLIGGRDPLQLVYYPQNK